MPVIIYNTDKNGKELTKYTLKDNEHCYIYSFPLVSEATGDCLAHLTNYYTQGYLGDQLEYSGEYKAEQVIKTFMDSELFNEFLENKIKDYFSGTIDKVLERVK